MGDEDWQVRRAAVRALAAPPTMRRSSTRIVAALRDGHRNFSLLSSALQLLTMTGVDSTDALVRLMQDPDADLRIQAALALGTQRRPAAADALLRALDDPDANVRFHAIEALGKLAPPAAIEPLAQRRRVGRLLPRVSGDRGARAYQRSRSWRRASLPAPGSGSGASAPPKRSGRSATKTPSARSSMRSRPSPTPVGDTGRGARAIHREYETSFAGGVQIEDLVRSAV